MATITFKGATIHTKGDIPSVGDQLPDFILTTNDMSRVSLKDFAGKKLVLNVFISLDTGTCANSVRAFNKMASDLDNTVVLCISRDLPFAQKRFCGTEGIEDAITLSDFASGRFGQDYKLEIVDSALAGLHSRVVIVADESGKVIYTEQVQEASEEPDYEAALEALRK
jgi:thiol peroxidase